MRTWNCEGYKFSESDAGFEVARTIGTITPVDKDSKNSMVSELDAGKADWIVAMDVTLSLFEIRELFEKRFELLKPGILDAAQRLFDRLNKTYGQSWEVQEFEEIEDEECGSIDTIEYPKVAHWGDHCNCPSAEILVVNKEGSRYVLSFVVNDRNGWYYDMQLHLDHANSLVYKWLGIEGEEHTNLWEPILI